MNHDDPIRGPLYRWSLDALREYRRRHRREWHARPRLYRRIPIRVFEPHDMLKLMIGVVGSIEPGGSSPSSGCFVISPSPVMSQ